LTASLYLQSLYLRITGSFLHTQFTITLRILEHAAMFLVQYLKIRWTVFCIN